MPRPPRTEGRGLGHPLFLLNLKAYPSAVGDRGLALGEQFARATSESGLASAIAPSAPDLGRLAERLWIPVLAQHTDPWLPGARTGFLVAEALAAAGVRGSLVNHSEHPLPGPLLADSVRRLTEVGLSAVVCARDARVAGRLAKLRPPYLAVEPPELIGGKVSVSTARPELISATVSAVHRVSPRTHVLCGAGIHDRRDVSVALELGAEGILVASAVATAKRPAPVIRDLIRGF